MQPARLAGVSFLFVIALAPAVRADEDPVYDGTTHNGAAAEDDLLTVLMEVTGQDCANLPAPAGDDHLHDATP